MKTIAYYMNLPYRLELVPDTEEGGFVASYQELRGCLTSVLHLIRPLGFDISDKAVKRAGLDYWHLVDVRDYENLDDFFSGNDVRCMRLFSTKAPRSYDEADYPDGAYLFFGKETKGLPEEFLAAHYDSCVRIPIRAEARSLNLGNSAAIGVFEALRQQGFPHLKAQGKMIDW